LTAIANTAAAASQQAGGPDLTSTLQNAEQLEQLASSIMGAWSPSPYFGQPQPPSWGLPSRRPISFADAYGRIYGPQPRYFRFPKAF
jgi:hypothetical protein